MAELGDKSSRRVTVGSDAQAVPAAPEPLQVQPLDRPPSLTEAAVRQLREAIINGDLPLGQPLSEHVLASQLNISKTPVREALAQLRTEGLVTIVPHKGTFVFTLRKHEVAELCEYRATLETAALRLSFERAPEALADSLERILERMADARARSDERAYLRLNTEFHQEFFARCGNSYMTDAYRLIAAKVAALRTHLSLSPSQTEERHEEHEGIVEAIRRGAVADAIDALGAHINSARRSYQQLFGKTSAGGEKRSRARGSHGLAVVMATAQDEQILALMWDLCHVLGV